MKLRLLFLFLITLIGPFNLRAQTSDSAALDSLKHLYYTNMQGAAGVNYAEQISKMYTHDNMHDSAMRYANMGITVAKKLKLKPEQAELLRLAGNVYNAKGNYINALANYQQALKLIDTVKDKETTGKIYNNMGTVEERQGNYSKAFAHFNKALSLFARINDKKNISSCYSNMGLIFHDQGNYTKAIEYDQKALAIEEVMDQPYLMATTLNNIGNIYRVQKNEEQALEYFGKAAEKFQAADNKQGVALVNTNIGLIYKADHDYGKAMDYFTKSLSIFNDVGDEKDMADCYDHMGETYFEQGEMGKAMENNKKALQMYDDIGDQHGVSESMNDISTEYFASGKYNEALKSDQGALAIATDIYAPDLLSDINEQLSKEYEQMKQPDKALRHYKNFIALRDSMNDEESTKRAIRAQLTQQFEKEQQAAAMENEKKTAVADEAARRQKAILYFVIGILVLVVLFAIFMVNRFMVIRTQQKTIITQKELVENKNKIIEEKNKDITDSIHYARDIQRALMPGEEDFKGLFPESFVLYMPKDIVSGDFYWMAEKDGKALLLAADCTGHGVPGALMSMIGVSLFNETVGKKEIVEPGSILSEVRKGIINTFKQKGDSQKQHRDGMDAGLCSIDMNTMKAEFAGAYNPLWIIKKSSPTGILEVTPDKQPVGIQEGQRSTFTTHDIQLEKGDTVFLFSDGYADQFGGPKGKKFKYRQLQYLLLAINKLPMAEQKTSLERNFMEWKGELEQVDDVLIIGIRV